MVLVLVVLVLPPPLVQDRALSFTLLQPPFPLCHPSASGGRCGCGERALWDSGAIVLWVYYPVERSNNREGVLGSWFHSGFTRGMCA